MKLLIIKSERLTYFISLITFVLNIFLTRLYIKTNILVLKIITVENSYYRSLIFYKSG